MEEGVCAEGTSQPLDGLWVFSCLGQQAEVFGCTEAERRAQDSYREPPKKSLFSH